MRDAVLLPWFPFTTTGARRFEFDARSGNERATFLGEEYPMRTRSIRAVTARAASGVLLALTACGDQVTAPRVTPDALSSGYGGSRAAFVA